MMQTRIITVVTLIVFAGAANAEETVDFNRDVRPILSDKCFRCHGPDEGERATDLRLDRPEIATSELESGAIAIVPRDQENSELIHRITSHDADIRMPPADSGKSLSVVEIKILQDWIRQGADWDEHWSFLPPTRPALPDVVHSNYVAWPNNPIDRFVLARQLESGKVPASRAPKYALIRRVTFDLTGLPPTPAEIARFESDDSPDAYERLVDRLLNSPRYGEHMARYWLDVARYGDTHGLHLDNERSIWPYRDWVIRAFNSNMPFDQFTIEQLAGDLLPNPTRDQLVATGFNRCNVTTSEGGSIDEEYYFRYAVDRVETTSTVWMGLTTGCAVCHDHKFDPITQVEFYELLAYFNNLTEKAMDGNALLPPPAIQVPTAAQLRDQAAARELHDKVTRRLAERKTKLQAPFEQWAEQTRQELTEPSIPSDDLLHVSFDEQGGTSAITSTVIGKSSTDAGRVGEAFRFDGNTAIEYGEVAAFELDEPFSYGAWIYCVDDKAMTVLSKMDDADAFRGYDLYVGGGKLFVHLVHQWDTNAIRVNTRQPIRREKWQHVMATYDGSRSAAGVRIFVDGIEQELEITHDTLTGTIKTDKPLRIGRRRDSAPFQGIIDELRIFGRQLSADEVSSLAGIDPIREILAADPEERSADQTATLFDYYISKHDQPYRELLAEQKKTAHDLSQIEKSFPSTLVMREREKPRQTHVLIRGQYDQKGKPVTADVPNVLPVIQSEKHRLTNRLDLARWLVDPRHPLTARVTVNRMWQQHFGTGIVKTSEDFGSQGEWPSHPDLLDWLAVEFVESGWDVKAVHRLIVTSATYQQSSHVPRESYVRDPENRLLARGPRYRLDAEQIRDNALLISGLLTEKIGGRSVKPYQPDGLWSAVGYTTSNTAKFKRDSGADLYRRGLYTFWKRTSPPPMMQIFDAPSREVCTVNRPRTNTPAGALALMNDVQFVEAARNFAERILLESSSSPEERIRFGYLWATSRTPSPQETSLLRAAASDFIQYYGSDHDAALELLSVGESKSDESLNVAELAAWTMVASTILNLDETITKQ